VILVLLVSVVVSAAYVIIGLIFILVFASIFRNWVFHIMPFKH